MTFGTPLDPNQIPPASATAQPFMPVGLDLRANAASLPAGVSSQAINLLITAEGLIPRSGLTVLGPSAKSSSASWFGANNRCMGVYEYFTSGITQLKTLVAVSGQTLIWHDGSAWTKASYSSNATTSPSPLADNLPTAGCVVFDPVNGENALVFTGMSNQRVQMWPGPYVGSGQTYSNLTGAPVGPCALTYFDTRVVFGNCISGNSRIGQRVIWSARGDPQTYTAPDGGLEDIVSMRGQITYLTDDGDRLVIFSEREIWAGYRADFPYGLSFSPLDRMVGCPHPYSVSQTPVGIMFLGHDENVYLLPKGAAQAVPIGTTIWPQIRKESIQRVTNPALVGLNTSTQPPFDNLTFGVFDPWRGHYHLYVLGPGDDVATSGVSGPRLGYVYSVPDQAWSRVSVPVYLTCGVAISANSAYPGLYFGTSMGTVFGMPSLESSSVATQDFSSNFSGSALFAIGNPNPAVKLYLRDVLIDYSNASCPSGSSLTIALSADFGQTYDKSIGVALPHTLYSRQTVVNLDYAATYPSVELQYESQVSGHNLKIRRVTALVGQLGTPGLAG